ncbi:flippase-like domain-containing protein [Marivirga sp. S37H4]|uniref:Flippase-like domain-containing protein n=1 Tax=Marivirga aurantiaca TaxID=2802615 RepID=A0A934WYN1_9BACT|nr:lysylphosphatidylglycerol synthase transmembrane domain-containing protein [Marivirga aurantiaca]MBK6265608.1 flippase-like domain-containing protein [Marivirga aurantiaca]
MRRGIKSFLKYSISLAVAILVFWYLYKDVNLVDMLARFKKADLSWVYLSILLALLSHLVRAYRWNMLLEPMGYKLKTFRTFLAVMVGYLANFVVPRMGEISRCGILQKTDGVPISKGIGSVVTERVVDVLCLFSIIVITLFLEFDRLSQFFAGLVAQKTEGINNDYVQIAGILAVLLLVTLFLIFFLKRNHERFQKNLLYNKAVVFLRQMVEGILSIRHLKKPTYFWISTLVMWILYYLMTYVVIFSLEETSGLSIIAGFTMLVLGGVGMAAPVQGGIGAFHYLMSAGLLLYGVPENDGVFFALLIHTMNSLAIILVGVISFFISMIIPKRKAKPDYANS